MVTALQDLQNRINSNTLTAAQQAALSMALTAIIPIFPTPDEVSGGILNEDQPSRAEWIAALYAIQSEGTAGGSAVLPTNQIVWHINAVTGVNTNNGLSSATPIQSAAYLASLWRGTVGGGRPQLEPSSGTTITVFLDTDLPNTDPISVLLDVDLPDGTQLNIFGAAKAASHTGTLATASVFAQTSAGGQQTITDAAVPDYHPFVGAASLVQDSTAGGVAWLLNPLSGASATGTLTRFYTPQVAGTIGAIAPVTPVAADAYTLSDVTHCTLGQAFITRSFPDDVASASVTGMVVFYRLHFVDPNASATAFFADSPTVSYIAQECIVDTVNVEAINSELALINCLLLRANLTVANGAVVEAEAGGLQGAASGSVLAQNSGEFLGDLDFVVVSDGVQRYACASAGLMALGQVGAFHNTGAGGPMLTTGGAGAFVSVNPIAAATAIMYGTDNGNFAAVGGNNAQVRYTSTSVNHFKSTNVTFTLGKGLTTGYGFSQATGAYVGTTTFTQAHQDAVLGAGTGFGGTVNDPTSGDIFAAL